MEAVVLLLLAGAILLFAETLLPGLVAGTAGVGCLVAAVVLAYRRWGESGGHLVLGVVLAGLTLGTWAWLKFFPESRFARRFISPGISGPAQPAAPALLNESGLALTPLRPSGKVLFQGRPVDVVTEGGWIERGSPVRVVSVEGMRVVVRAD